MRMLTLVLAFSIIMLVSGSVMAEANPEVCNLWPDGGMPGAKEVNFEEKVDSGGHISGISVPELHYYPAEKQTSDATIVICPGGGYAVLSFEKEGIEIAKWFNSQGMNAFVVKNRLKEYGQPYPLADVQRAIRLVRKNSDQYNINPNKIGVMGFSAGGHLAASASVLYNEKAYEMEDDREISARPDFSVLVYPVITMGQETHWGSRENLIGKNPSQDLIDKYCTEKQIDKNTPPAILIHSSDDGVVPVANPILYYQSLIANKVDAEMHIYNTGGHGYGMRKKSGTVQYWQENLAKWLAERKYTLPKANPGF